MRLDTVGHLEDYRKSMLAKEDPEKQKIIVCGGTGCISNGSLKVADAFTEELKNRKIDADVDVRICGCHGFCERGPLVIFMPQDIFYQMVTVKAVPELIEKTIIAGEPHEKFLYEDPNTKEKILKEGEISF